MSNKEKRIFKKGEVLYVIDCWGTTCGMHAFEASARIIHVDEEIGSFDAVLYGDTYQRYNVKDYGRLIFDDESEAKKAAYKLPKPNSYVYQLIGNRVFEKIVVGVRNENINNFTDLVVHLNKGKSVPIGRIGIELFLDESSAREKTRKIN